MTEKTEAEFVTTPIAVFRTTAVHLLVSMHGPKGGPNQHIYRIVAAKIFGAPLDALSLEQLLALRALIDEAVRTTLTSTAVVLSGEQA